MDILVIWNRWVEWVFGSQKKIMQWLFVCFALILFSVASLVHASSPICALMLFATSAFLPILYHYQNNYPLFAFACLIPICYVNAAPLTPIFMFLWLSSLFLSLFVFSHFMGEAKTYLGSLEDRAEEMEKQAKLWQSRFETVREKIKQDREVLEQEIEGVRAEVAEKQKYITSLKSLITVSHRESSDAREKVLELGQVIDKLKLASPKQKEEISVDGKLIDQAEVTRIMDDLNFYRTEHYQLTLLLQEAKDKLQAQEEAIIQRQKRNQTLLSTGAPKAISLKDLAKGL